MIAITGASGHLGQATLNYLLPQTSPDTLVAIVRDLTKATELTRKGIQVRQADYSDSQALLGSLAGVDILVLISATAQGDERVRQHANVINAAKEAGVTHIFYTSAPNPSPHSLFTPAIDHFATEQLIKASGLTYTIFRNNMYLDLFLPMVIGNATQTGQLRYPAGTGKISFVLRTDIAEGLANALTSTGHENKVYDIGAPTAWSFSDIATAISQPGNRVEYVDIPTDVYQTELQKQLPAPVVELYIGTAEGLKQNEFNQPTPTLEKLLNRQPVSLKAYLQTAR